MLNSIPLLTILALLPLVGAVVLPFLKGHAAKLAGLGFAVATLVLGVVLFVVSQSTPLAEDVVWVKAIGAHYALAMDGMSGILVLLTVILVPLVMIAEWNVEDSAGARWSTGAYFALALAMQAFALFVFLASDVLLFYIAFEATLIPMYFLIAGWGGPKRKRAALKFLLVSLAGGLVMLVGVAGVYAVSAAQGVPTFLIGDLAAVDFAGTAGRWLFVAFFIAFAIKAPMAGLHTWLPDAAEQARGGTSTLLVGVLDKIGAFGMIKICLLVFPEASAWAAPVIVTWAVASMLYGALMALVSKNLMRFVSHTSISHFGFMIFGIFAMTSAGIGGAIFYMLAHGLSSAALFLVLGFLAERRGSAEISAFGGVQKVAPVLAGFFLVAGMATLSLPGLANFVGEFLTMAGGWAKYPVHTIIISSGIVLAAGYVLTVYLRTMTGPVTEQTAEHVRSDLSLREKWAVAPLLTLLIVFGFFPSPILSVANDTAGTVMTTIGANDPAPQIQEGN